MSTDCTRDAGHQGPCNGYPRIEGGLHCYTMRPECEHKNVIKVMGTMYCRDCRKPKRTESLLREPTRVHVPYSGAGKTEKTLGQYVDSRLELVSTLEAERDDLSHESAEWSSAALNYQARIVDLEAENARLATRVNELIAMTATNH